MSLEMAIHRESESGVLSGGRTREKVRRESPLDGEPQNEFVSPEPSVFSALDTLDMERQVHQVMSGLAERDRGLLRCVLMEDRDKGEICAEFGVTLYDLESSLAPVIDVFGSYLKSWKTEIASYPVISVARFPSAWYDFRSGVGKCSSAYPPYGRRITPLNVW